MTEDQIDAVSKALRQAWQLGQTYRRQADSESYRENAKSDATQAKFDALVDQTRALLSASIADTAGAKPEGYALVPVDPTHLMIGAGARAVLAAWEENRNLNSLETVKIAYAAMLGAAPPAPSVADAAGDIDCGAFYAQDMDRRLAKLDVGPQVADAAGASYDAQDAARYRWLRDRGFKYADVSLGTDCDEENFVEFKPRFHIPEPLGMDYEKSEWTATEIDSSVDAAIAKESGND